jgi:PAS domain S-box-containing protein
MILKKNSENNHRLVNIIDDLKDGFCTITLDGEFVYFNHAAADLIGFKGDANLNFYKDIVTDEEQITIIKSHLEVNDFLKDYELDLTNCKNIKFPSIISITKIKDLSGNTIGMSILIKDMTYLKKVQQQLMQAQKMESIGMLASGVAHEFNNILTGIIPNAELIKLTTNSDDSNHSRAESIEISANRAAEIVKKLLNFARDDNKIDTKFVNLAKAINETLEILKRLFDRKIELISEIEDNLLMVKIDYTSIQQIIMNLAINAKDAINDKGKILFSAKNYIFDEKSKKNYGENISDGNYVKFEVKDTGQGINSENIKYIFDPFFTTKGPGQGTGLGLSMVYGIVKSVKGIIEVESQVGIGTTFTIYFPANKIIENQIIKESKVHKIGNDRTVLVVDDETIILDIISDMLISLNFKVITAPNGSQALKIYKNNQNEIDLVILDLIMPEMNGTTCFQNLMKINPKIKVIISSGAGEVEKRKYLSELGISEFLEKPYNLNTLAQKIYKVLQ